MKYLYAVLFLTIFSCNGQKQHSDSNKSSEIHQNIKEINNEDRLKIERDYIKRRNANVEYFKNQEINDRIDNQMNDSIIALENLLKNILATTKIENIHKTGKINLQTFFPELGFGMLDALGIYTKESRILCTTTSIFADYYKEQEYKIEKLSESEMVNIFYDAFAANYSITSIASFKINTSENIPAYGIIAIDRQDVGPFSPNSLYAIAFVDDYVYLMSKTIETALKPVEKCINIWDDIDRLSEDTTWKNYIECYKNAYKNNEQQGLLKKEIEGMLQSIIK